MYSICFGVIFIIFKDSIAMLANEQLLVEGEYYEHAENGFIELRS